MLNLFPIYHDKNMSSHSRVIFSESVILLTRVCSHILPCSKQRNIWLAVTSKRRIMNLPSFLCTIALLIPNNNFWVLVHEFYRPWTNASPYSCIPYLYIYDISTLSKLSVGSTTPIRVHVVIWFYLLHVYHNDPGPQRIPLLYHRDIIHFCKCVLTLYHNHSIDTKLVQP